MGGGIGGGVVNGGRRGGMRGGATVHPSTTHILILISYTVSQTKQINQGLKISI